MTARKTVTLYVPDGYRDADEFLKDCQFERAISAELPSRSEMVSLIAAIIQDEAKYNPATNTWNVETAAEAIFTAFEMS
jgi:hypothetical protein